MQLSPLKAARFSEFLSYFKVMKPTPLIITAMAVFIFGTAITAHDAAADMARCDQLAALEADPMAASDPVDFDDLQADAVIKTCLQALNDLAVQDQINQDPMVKGRLLLQLGRGYLAAGEIDDALEHFNKSAELHYPAGVFALGVFHLVGEGGKQDLTAAHAALNQAFDMGVVWSARALAMLHLQEDSEFYAPEKAAFYQQLWADQ